MGYSKTPMVEVIWEDANFEDEYNEADAAYLGPVELRTLGYLTAETDEALVLAMTLCDEDNKVVTEQMVIPWGMVLEWGELKDA
jgi:hypothetical protein